MDNKTFEIRVKGIVQGVGFRPFIYRMATDLSLKGEVLNDTEGVLIRINAKTFEIPGIEMKIRGESPPLSKIDSIVTKEIEYKPFKEFEVVESETTDHKSTFIPQDTAICKDCKKELFDKNNRRYNFPFINCTNCGPRFSIINDIPYDRKLTSMNKFPMCDACKAEYDNPSDRRFHTEPTSCPVCGPKYFLFDNTRTFLSEKIVEIVNLVVNHLKDGRIVAIKGEGGYHLAADATNDKTVILLRERKQRPFKPFALMLGDIDTASAFLEISETERELLLSKERPIILLKEKKKIVAKGVAPGLTHLGIMLPYSPMQHLIFNKIGDTPLIMTSGNISDEPIISEEDELFEKLSTVADFFVTSDRDIVQQSDDSVLFVSGESPFMIRRAKGFVPVPIFGSKSDRNIFAAGSDIKNSFALSKENLVFVSQYIGDLQSPLTEKKYVRAIDHFRNLFEINPSVFVSDLHPGYFSTAITDNLWNGVGKRVKVQHHHAHVAAVLEENKTEDKVIGVSFDGTGFGDDGHTWGGEFLITDKKEYFRAAHFNYFPLPGGDTAVKEVWRTGLSLILKAFGYDIFTTNPKRELVEEMINKKINIPLCCSIGRLFDGVSSILGLSDTVSTEAEAAQLVEEAALRSVSSLKFPFEISGNGKNNPFIIDSTPLIKELGERRKAGISPDDLALAFHNSISEITVEILIKLRDIYDINKIVLSGGVFHNRLLLNQIMKKSFSSGFEVLLPRELPFNDGAIAFGQIAVAKTILGF